MYLESHIHSPWISTLKLADSPTPSCDHVGFLSTFRLFHIGIDIGVYANQQRFVIFSLILPGRAGYIHLLKGLSSHGENPKDNQHESLNRNAKRNNEPLRNFGFEEMPVKRLYFWQPNAGVPLTKQMFVLLCKCIEEANASRESRVKANVVQYRPILKEENQRVDCVRDFLGISFEEQPDKHFFVIRANRLVVESDSNLPSILEKLQSYRKAIALAFEGVQYRFGDFQLKVFRVSQTETLKAVVMEVEYLPLSSLEKTRVLMDEFLELWQEMISLKSPSGHLFNIDPNFGEYRLSDEYSWQHTAVLYSNAMAQAMSN